MLFRIALTRVVVSVRTYRQSALLEWHSKHVGKPASIGDDDQRLRALGWPVNVSRDE